MRQRKVLVPAVAAFLMLSAKSRAQEAVKTLEESLPVRIGQPWPEAQRALAGGESRKIEGAPLYQHSWSDLDIDSPLGKIAHITIESLGEVVQSIWVRIDSKQKRQCRQALSKLKASVSPEWQEWRTEPFREHILNFYAASSGVRLWGHCAEPGSVATQRSAKRDSYMVRIER